MKYAIYLFVFIFSTEEKPTDIKLAPIVSNIFNPSCLRLLFNSYLEMIKNNHLIDISLIGENEMFAGKKIQCVIGYNVLMRPMIKKTTKKN